MIKDWDLFKRRMIDGTIYNERIEKDDPSGLHDMRVENAYNILEKIVSYNKMLSSIGIALSVGNPHGRPDIIPEIEFQGTELGSTTEFEDLMSSTIILQKQLDPALKRLENIVFAETDSVGVEEEVWVMEITDQMKKNSRALTPKFQLKIPAEAGKVIDDKIGEQPVPIKKTVKTMVDDFFTNFKTRTLDRLNPIKQKFGEGMVYMLHRGLPGISSSIGAFLEHGKLRFADSGSLITDEINKGFVPWFHKLGADGQKFMYWRVAQRARKLLSEGREKLFSEGDIRAIESWVGSVPTDSGYLSWDSINSEFNEFNDNILDLAESSGLISKDFRNYMQDDGFYVPFYRVLEDPDSNAEFTKAPFHNKQYK